MAENIAEQMKAYFRSFDKNGDSTISRDELLGVFDTWTEAEVDQMLALTDANQDGTIDYEEFVNWVMGQGGPPAEAAFSKIVQSLGDAPLVEQPEEYEVRGSAPTGDYSTQEDEGDESLGKCNPLAEGIDFFTAKADDAFAFTYHIRNKKLATLEFSLNLEGSTNMWCEGWGEDVLSNTVEAGPHETALIGVVSQKDPSAGAGLKYRMSWQHKPLDTADFAPFKEEFDAKISEACDKMREAGIVATDTGCDAAAIREKCQGIGEKFTDVEFAPGDGSLYIDGAKEGKPPIVWKRPSEIFTDVEVSLFGDGIRPNDIDQGALGDCWFLSSLSCVAEFPEIVQQFFQATPEYNEEGVYEITCFKDGQATRILIDDYLPCLSSNGKPCYSQNSNGKLWVLLMEKCWAKIHGSYEAIEGGQPHRALMDFTGEPGETFRHAACQEEIDSGSFINRLKTFDECGYLLCASTPGHDKGRDRSKKGGTGIVPGHAYSLISVKEAQGEHVLLLRNPWGEYEWGGDWSDQSGRWDEETKAALGYDPSQADGKFWMSFSDFLTRFEAVSVCYARRSDEVQHWAKERTVVNHRGGDGFFVGCSEFSVQVECRGFACIWQHDDRVPESPTQQKIAFAIYQKKNEGAEEWVEISRGPTWATREVVQTIDTLEPGSYVVCFWNCSLLEPDENYKASQPSGRFSRRAAPEYDQEHKSTFVLCLRATDGSGPDAVGLTMADVKPGARRYKLASVASASKGDPNEYWGMVRVVGGWQPHGGFAMHVTGVNDGLAGTPAGGLRVKVNFGGCQGIEMPDGSTELNGIVVSDSATFLLADLRPTASSRNMSYNLGAEYPSAEEVEAAKEEFAATQEAEAAEEE